MKITATSVEDFTELEKIAKRIFHGCGEEYTKDMEISRPMDMGYVHIKFYTTDEFITVPSGKPGRGFRFASSSIEVNPESGYVHKVILRGRVDDVTDVIVEMEYQHRNYRKIEIHW